MASGVRLIAVDMDGTLLDRDGNIPEENVRALMDAQAAGITVCINTGRMVADAADVARRAGLACAIAGNNGAHIVDARGRTMRSVCIPEETARGVCALAIESGLRLLGYFDGLIVTVTDGDPMAFSLVRRRLVPCRMGAQALMESVPAGMRKIIAIGEADDPRVAALRAEAIRRYPRLSVVSSWNNNVEIGPEGAGKDSALAAICGQMGISTAQAMAIGDAENDLPMLRIAGYSVAMGNATEPVKAACRFETRDNASAGVAWAVRKWALEEANDGRDKSTNGTNR